MPKHAETPNYENELKKSLGQFKEPERLPGGQWIVRCTGGKYTPNDEYREGADGAAGNMGVALLTHVPVRAGDNVDTEKVEGGAWRGKKLFTRVYIRDESDVFKFAQVVRAHGIDPDEIEGEGSGADLINSIMEAAAPMLRNRTAEATVGLRTYTNRSGETVIENTLSNFAAA